METVAGAARVTAAAMVVNNAMPARAAHSLARGLPDSLYSDYQGEVERCGEASAAEEGGLTQAAMPMGTSGRGMRAARQSPGKALRRTLSPDAPFLAAYAFSSGPTSDEDGPSPARSGNNALPAFDMW